MRQREPRTLRLAIAGATGRTGRCVLERAAGDERFAIAAALTSPGCSTNGTVVRAGEAEITIADSLAVECDVLIDFTVAAGTMAWLEVCVARRIPMVIGATGHDDEQRARIEKASQAIPIVMAANFSVGVQAILRMIGKLAMELGDGYDVEIVETHHRHKVDAPSGTALTLADEIAAATGRTRESGTASGHQGRTGRRPPGEIGIQSVRMGEIVSRHDIHFSGPGETITIRHEGHSRDTFAIGALCAATWIVDKQPGFYTMRDVMEATDS